MRARATPEQIDDVTELLRKVWKKYPEQRLGQLLHNLAGDKELYQLEEHEFTESMLRLYETGRWP